MDYEELAGKASEATARFNALTTRLKELETALADNGTLQKHIVNYSKTRVTYVEYRKAGYSKRFRETHEADILLHQASKRAFDEAGFGKGKKLPTIASLRAAYGEQLEEKKKVYREYRQAKDEMKELLVVKANVDRLLNIPDRTPDGSRLPEREPGAPNL